MIDLTEIYILDLIGTFAFAVYGAHVALERQFDIFGIFVSAFLTAFGGGTLRELILGNIPFYFYDNNYIFVCLAGYAFSIAVYKIFYKINKYMIVVDAVGLSTFALIGAQKAYEANLGAFAIIFLATITAVGGGLLRDISIREVPQILHREFYASPAIFLGVCFAIYFKFALWRPWNREKRVATNPIIATPSI